VVGLVVCLATAGLSLWLLGRREEAPKASRSVASTANNETEHAVLTGIREGPMER
jgi:hypothetical protein